MNLDDGTGRSAIADWLRHRRAEELRDEKRRCEDSLIAFMERAWQEIETDELEINWHHRLVADYLEDIAFDRLKTLIVNIPPRHTKSLLCSVMFPAWVWVQPEERRGPHAGPHVGFLCVSYAAELSEEIALKMYRLVTGRWYQRHWGDRVEMRTDQKSRKNFANHKGGARTSLSIEGGILGRGQPIQIVDDPHSTAAQRGIESATERAATEEGMRQLSTRVTDPRKVARILVMQRLHEQDATNYALENWHPRPRHIMLPARFDVTRADADDPRIEDGELLWPRVWTPEILTATEKELTEYGTAGQMQQSPIPRGGGIIQARWWRLWPEDAPEAMAGQIYYRCSMCKWLGATQDDWCPQCGSEALERQVPFPPFSFRFLSVDTNYGEKEENSFSAVTSWGIWHGPDMEPRMMLTEAWRGRPRLYGEMIDGVLKRGLVDQVFLMATRPSREADEILIEKKTRGVDLYNELERAVSEWPYRLVYFEPTGRGDKGARLVTASGAFIKELIWAPEKQWARTVIDETAAAPRGQFSDLADTVSSAIIHARDARLIMHKDEHQREELRRKMFRPRRQTAGELIEGR